MPAWTQQGFASVTDSTLGPPLVIGFHLTRWEAEAELARVRDQCGDLTGSTLEKPMASARVVPATLRFDDAEPA